MYDGFNAVRQEMALAQTCSSSDCDARAVVLRDGSLYCTGHVPQFGVS